MTTTDKEFNVLTDNKIFYKGVIEDNNDPLKIGRVRVRVLGVHDSSTTLVPVNTLPWAITGKSLDFGGFQSGMGISSVPTKGTWVWCFFDNNDINSPVVIMAIPGITKTKQSGHGFTDPSGTYPLSSYLGQSDHSSAQVSGYLSNHVIQTPGGQLLEMNDGGHIKITHANGSFVQIENNGNYNVNITNNEIITIAGSATINITGDATITAPNVEINGQVKINGDLTVSGSTNSGSINLNTHTHNDPQGGNVGTPINS